MKLVYGNLWDYEPDGFPGGIWRGVTTNTNIRTNGSLTMGSGVAGQAKNLFAGIAEDWGDKVRDFGSLLFTDPGRHLFAFPTKYDWVNDSDLDLIKDSARQLEVLAMIAKETLFVLPRPGVGKGNLEWAVVERTINFLPDNVHIIAPK